MKVVLILSLAVAVMLCVSAADNSSGEDKDVQVSEDSADRVKRQLLYRRPLRFPFRRRCGGTCRGRRAQVILRNRMRCGGRRLPWYRSSQSCTCINGKCVCWINKCDTSGVIITNGNGNGINGNGIVNGNGVINDIANGIINGNAINGNGIVNGNGVINDIVNGINGNGINGNGIDSIINGNGNGVINDIVNGINGNGINGNGINGIINSNGIDEVVNDIINGNGINGNGINGNEINGNGLNGNGINGNGVNGNGINGNGINGIENGIYGIFY